MCSPAEDLGWLAAPALLGPEHLSPALAHNAQPSYPELPVNPTPDQGAPRVTTSSRLATAVRQMLGALAQAIAGALGGTGAPSVARLSAALACVSSLLVFIVPTASADSCPNAAFRTGPSANLPDCRAYELVTPPFTEGAPADIEGLASDGSGMIVQSLGNFGCAGNNQTLSGASYELTRTAAGWSTACLDPAAAQFPYDVFLDATPDLGQTLWLTRATSQSTLALDLMVRDSDGTLHDLGPTEPPSETAGAPGLGFPQGNQQSTRYRGASTDFSRVLFSIQSNNGTGNFLWPGDSTAPGGTDSLYEYTAGQSGPPALVGVDDSGQLIGECGVEPGPPAAFFPADNGISTDGSVVFFTPLGADDRNCGAAQPPVDELFARIDESRTVAISEPSPNAECTTAACQSAPPADAEFEAASSDGSKVFFASTQQLTDGASEDGTGGDSATTTGCSATTGPGGCNLYLYDFDNPSGHDLVDVSSGDPNPRVRGVVSVSEDGSHVYFVAGGVLTGSQQNSSGATAADGADNLYVFERDAAFPTGHTSFIATLSPADSSQWVSNDGAGTQDTATPDGQFLAFSSVADLTPDDTSTAQQVFRYDAQTGELVRVSIGQDGFNDNGNTGAFDAAIPAAPAATLGGAVLQNALAISDDGAYVVFRSADGLTPQALNGELTDTPGQFAQNVYEYHDGEVQLISDGRDATSVEGESSVSVEGTTASGADVFFTTADQLVPQDTNTQKDIYDARIDGGFPAPVAPAGCSGDACQGAPSATPALPVAGSVTFSGPGNASPAASAKATPRVRITSKSVRGSTFLLRVKVPGKGRITASGAGVKTVPRSVTKAGTYTLKLGLTAKERTRLKRLKRGKKLKLKLRVAYAPASGRSSTATVSITVKA